MAIRLRMPQTPAHLIPVATGPRFWIVLRLPIRFAGATEITPGSLLVVPHGFFTDPLLFPLRAMLWGLLGLTLTVACWWPMLRSITKSLGRMEHATSEIAQGRFDTKVGVERADEIGRLDRPFESVLEIHAEIERREAVHLELDEIQIVVARGQKLLAARILDLPHFGKGGDNLVAAVFDRHARNSNLT